MRVTSLIEVARNIRVRRNRLAPLVSAALLLVYSLDSALPGAGDINRQCGGEL